MARLAGNTFFTHMADVDDVDILMMPQGDNRITANDKNVQLIRFFRID